MCLSWLVETFFVLQFTSRAYYFILDYENTTPSNSPFLRFGVTNLSGLASCPDDTVFSGYNQLQFVFFGKACSGGHG